MSEINLNEIPHLPGVYIIRDRFRNIIYIGKAKDLNNRVKSYFTDSSDLSFKISNIKMLAHKIDFVICDSEREALILERELIKKEQPFFNVMWKDSKSYPYIKITNEDFPRIFLTRKKLDDKAYYFGPYPKVEIVRKLLENLDKIKLFNLRKCKYSFDRKNPLDRKKMEKCIYYHTYQCPAPCDTLRISYKEYRKLVKIAVDFLKGKYTKLKKQFEKEMKKYSDSMEYEKAMMYRDFIKSIEHIYERVSFNQLTVDEIKRKLDTTSILLKLKNVLNLKRIPYHIEAFDVSNLFNKYSVATSVCFINGKKNTSHYRYFKMRFVPDKKGGNDFAMIYEAVKRRLNQILNSGENIPDLILIDGGKGQLAMAEKVLKELKIKTDLISLAKENEEIYIPGKSKPVVLDKSSDELLYLIRIRDEVHRFSVSYHRKLRSRDYLV